MLGRLLLLFIVVPLIELIILIDIGRLLGTGPAILIIVATGILGAYLARREGFKTLMAIREKLHAGQIPADELIDGLIILIAGALLITPGVLTDLSGFLLLFYPTRNRFRTWLKKRFSGSVTFSGGIQTPDP
ncbi:FxsA family protein [candidate division KSB1 bacterium]